MLRRESFEAARILSRYRKLVLLGKLRLPLDAARRLVGPDCAFHLYHRHRQPPQPAARGRRRSAARSSARDR